MFDTQVTVVGNLVAEPRLAFTKDGQAVASFRLASTPRRFDRTAGEWKDGDTLYTSVTCWRALAENVSASLKKGASVIVLGRLSVRPYETRDGAQRQSVDIDAIAIGPDLGRAIALVKRAERGVPAPVETALADPAPPSGVEGDDTDAPSGVDAPPPGVTDWGWSSGVAPAEASVTGSVAPEGSLGGSLDDEIDPDDDDDDDEPVVLQPAEIVEAAPPAQLTGAGGRWRSRSAG
jgi:single-strand DNA-binding protein